jgi:hypothetical protein
MEGFEEHSEQALAAISALNSGFLKEHFDNISPQIHLNSMAPAAALTGARVGKRRTIEPAWRVGSIAAGILLLFGLLWAFERNHNRQIVQPRSLESNTGGSGSDISAGSEKASSQTGNANTPANPNAALRSAQTLGVVTPSQNTKSQAVGSSVLNSSISGSATVASKTVSQSSAPVNTQNSTSSSANSETNTTADRSSNTSSNGSTGATHDGATNTFQEFDPVINGAEKKDVPADSKDKNVASPIKAEEDKAASENSSKKDSYGITALKESLKTQKKLMTNPDPKVRFQAMINAALCYNGLGERAKAEELLNQVINEGPGPERRAARHALHKLK